MSLTPEVIKCSLLNLNIHIVYPFFNQDQNENPFVITPQTSLLGILIPVLPVTMDSFGSVLNVVCVWLVDSKRAHYQPPSATLQAPATQIFSRWLSYVIARIT